MKYQLPHQDPTSKSGSVSLSLSSKFATNFELDHGPSIVDGNDRPVNSLALTRDQKEKTVGNVFGLDPQAFLPISSMCLVDMRHCR
jgi:hypothetical protein